MNICPTCGSEYRQGYRIATGMGHQSYAVSARQRDFGKPGVRCRTCTEAAARASRARYKEGK